MLVSEIAKPAIIGPYTLIEEIGRGSTGIVWKAKHDKTGLEVAIKIIPKRVISTPKKTTRFLREVEMLKTTEHPFIIDFYQHIEDDDNHYLVMEYAPRGDLATYIQNNGPLPEQLMKKFFIQIFSVLEYLHKTVHISHRDFKAENILIDESFNIRVIDFGMSIGFVDEEQQFNTVCGSKHYIAPEIYKGEPYSVKADIWSFGVIAYFMAVGKLPFHENNIQKTMNKILFSPPSFPDNLATETIDLISRMLTKLPDQRITLDDIKMHAFFSPREYNSIAPYVEHFSSFSFSPNDINDCEGYDTDPSLLRQCLATRQFNDMTSMWRLIKRKKLFKEISSNTSIPIHRKRNDSLNPRKFPHPTNIKSTSPITNYPFLSDVKDKAKEINTLALPRLTPVNRSKEERPRSFTQKTIQPNFF